MLDTATEYLLERAPNEIERLQKWGLVWEPEAEAMLDHIGVQPGWRCLDLGCGPMGNVSALRRRVGPAGHVVAVDINPKQLAATRELTQAQGLTNTSLCKPMHLTLDCPANRSTSCMCAFFLRRWAETRS